MKQQLFARARIIRLYNHSNEQRSLLDTIIYGLLSRFCERHWIPIRYIRCGWRYGPHIDVVLRAHHGKIDFAEDLAESLRQLTLQPAALNTVECSQRTERLARIEQIPPPFLPIRPHGTVELLEDRDSRWPAPLAQARDSILSKLTTAAAAETSTGSELRSRIVQIMLDLARSSPVGLALGALSYRSHVEAFFAQTTRYNVRDVFVRRFEMERRLFDSAVEQHLHEEALSTVEWRSAIEYGWGSLNSLVSAGILTYQVLDRLSGITTSTMPDTEFHRTFMEAGLLSRPAPWFTVYRCMLNFLYSTLPLLDISPAERYYICYGLSESVDSTLGSTWQQRLDEVRDDMAS